MNSCHVLLGILYRFSHPTCLRSIANVFKNDSLVIEAHEIMAQLALSALELADVED